MGTSVPLSLYNKVDRAQSTIITVFIEVVYRLTMEYEAHIDF